jgi:5-methylcytosine-specific restriction endonuclease McrA
MAYADVKDRQAYFREWQRRNREKVRAYNKAWYAANKDSLNATLRAKRATRPPEEGKAEYLRYKERVPPSLFRARSQMTRVKQKYPHLVASSCSVAEFQAWFEQQGSASCRYCGDAASEVDHVLPLSRGGTHTLDNLQMICDRCNRAKWDSTHDEFEAWILRLKV